MPIQAQSTTGVQSEQSFEKKNKKKNKKQKNKLVNTESTISQKSWSEASITQKIFCHIFCCSHIKNGKSSRYQSNNHF